MKGNAATDLERVRKSLAASRIKITKEERNTNDNGYRILCEDGAIINVYDTGKIVPQGKNTAKVIAALGLASPVKKATLGESSGSARPYVFVVYGHDKNARNELEAMLRRWRVEPLILDSLPSEGDTIIEKLMKYCGGDAVSFAVVLATPDDVGSAAAQPQQMRPRARQNVVLELGMLLTKLGRDKVAIFRPPKEQMEAPSDIDGLILTLPRN